MPIVSKRLLKNNSKLIRSSTLIAEHALFCIDKLYNHLQELRSDKESKVVGLIGVTVSTKEVLLSVNKQNRGASRILSHIPKVQLRPSL